MGVATQRVLVVRPDHLGDLLLTLPAVGALRQALPGADITVAAPDAALAAARLCPDIDHTLAVAFPPMAEPLDRTGWPVASACVGAELRGRFDVAILPRPDDPWSGHLVAAAGVPQRIGYDAARTRPFLTHAIPLPGREHVVATAARAVAAATALLGAAEPIEIGQPRPVRLVTTDAHEREADRVLDRCRDRAQLVLHPGSGWMLKNWSEEDWGRVACALAERHGCAPLVTGSEGERGLVEAVVAASEGRARGLAGELSLGGLTALYRRVRVVAGVDSGPVQLAALLGTPVVALFGPADPLVFGPWCPEERRRIVRIALPCSPCGNLLDPPCGARRRPACVAGIRVGAVVAAIEDLLAAR